MDGKQSGKIYFGNLKEREVKPLRSLNGWKATGKYLVRKPKGNRSKTIIDGNC
jgi:hypothetical protein